MEQIPQSERDTLAALYADATPDNAPAGLDRLRLHVTALREAGWSLREISEAFDPPVARSTIRSWEVATLTPRAARAAALASSTPAPAPDVPVPVRPNPPRTTRSAQHPAATTTPLLPYIAARIAELAPQAARLRAGTSSTSRARKASDELDELVAAALDEGVTIATLARAARVTHRAMSTRAKRVRTPDAPLPPATSPTPPTPLPPASTA